MNNIIISDKEILHRKLCILMNDLYRSQFEVTFHKVMSDMGLYFNSNGHIVIDSDQLTFLLLKYSSYLSNIKYENYA